MNKGRVSLWLTFLIATQLLLTQRAFAHFMWINANPYRSDVGKEVKIEVEWGHRFPKDSPIKKGLLKALYVLAPDGTMLKPEKMDEAHYSFIPRSRGTYVVFARTKSGFATKTVTGFKFQSKEGLKDVVKCFHFDRSARAFIAVGPPKAPARKPAKFTPPLEIVPLSNPCSLKKGDILKIKLLFSGSPLPYTYIYATYAGFSPDPNTFCYTTMTDRNGVAKIKITHSGTWLIKAFYKKTYPNPKICDEFNFVDSITFYAE